MANIAGFQMKNIKNTMGREGYGCLATLYLNGEKVGTYADYGDGAMGREDYVSKEAEEKMTRFLLDYANARPNHYMEKFFEEDPERYEEECERFRRYHPYIPEEAITPRTMAGFSLDGLVMEFLILSDMEKKFKAYTKKGYQAVGLTEDGDIMLFPQSWPEHRVREVAYAEGDSKCKDLYFSLEEFNISVDDLHFDAKMAALEKDEAEEEVDR